MLTQSRLVTLTGMAGVGKSRLALSAAAKARRSFADGVWLVELAGLPDGALLQQTVMNVVGIVDQSPCDPTQGLVDFLARRPRLLVGANREHLIDVGAALLAELLRSAPGLRILATSREVLRMPGEAVFEVGPLAVPDPAEAVRPIDIVEYPGIALFADRAAAVRRA